MTDAKYFTGTSKKGEIFELRAGLHDHSDDVKKENVKKIIASMTVGKDMSALFPDVVNCMQTDNLELKKLVYLYVMNYAKLQPDLAIMSVNTFVKDSDNKNALIRALAVRTMGCIKVSNITEYLCEPLRKSLKDLDPYVRKTAAVCVAKLHDINAELTEERGFLELLRDLLSDSNPMVVANAVAALSEIAKSSPSSSHYFEMNTNTINKLLAALNECTEWGQVFILECIANYNPRDEKEAQSILERVTPRLSHANPTVVLSAIKVIMKYTPKLPAGSQFVQNLEKKMMPPLITLMSSEPEIQYVALRNINLIIQKNRSILKDEIHSFFVKYDDPVYVKMEKLDIMVRLASPQNIARVLSELKEIAKSEVVVDFVKKAVRSIGQCAIKVEVSAEKCVTLLLELISEKVSYVVEEAIVVMKDIFRRYPNKYESVILTLCQNLDVLDDPEAKASMIWIIGEYAERIENAADLLSEFLEEFQDEDHQVQLQLMVAIVKLFLKKPGDTQELVQQVLSLATQDSDNPDLRDRGYIYWRLLSTDPQAAKEVVLAEKPLISEESVLEPSLLDELLGHITSLASVYHKTPNEFLMKSPTEEETQGEEASKAVPAKAQPDTFQAPASAGSTQAPAPQPPKSPGVDTLIGDLLGMEVGDSSGPTGLTSATGLPTPVTPTGGLDDLLGGLTSGPSPGAGGLDDLFGGSPSSASSLSSPYVPPPEIWLTAVNGKGLEIQGTFARRNKNVIMDLIFSNKSDQEMSGFAIQFNTNSFGLQPAAQLSVQTPLLAHQSTKTSLPLKATPQMVKTDPINILQIAVKSNKGVFYFSCNFPVHILFTEEGALDKTSYTAKWSEIPTCNQIQLQISNVHHTPDSIVQKLQCNNVFTVDKRSVGGCQEMSLSMSVNNRFVAMAELKIQPGNPNVMVMLKFQVVEIFTLIQQALENILQN